MNSQQVDLAIKAQMEHHLPEQPAGHTGTFTVMATTHCQACGDLWPCQYLIQASITLKLTAIANILSADQAAIIQGVVANGKATRQGKG